MIVLETYDEKKEAKAKETSLFGTMLSCWFPVFVGNW